MGVKISQLASLSEITPQDVLIINHNSATYQGDLDTIIGGYLDSASYINASNFSGYLFSTELSLGYFSSFVTQDYLSSQSYISYNDLFGNGGGINGYLDRYITSEYLSSQSYISYNDLFGDNEGTGGYLDNYITSSYLSEYLYGYLSEHLSEWCSGYITSDSLSSYLSEHGYITSSSLSEYLSNGSYMTYSNVADSFSALMNSGYLSDASNAYEVYKAISSYFNT